MSKYTTEVRYICENACGLTESEGFNSIENILEEAAPHVFNFNFPIFDEQYRLPLEIKILRHYYTREISEETVGLWKLRLDDRLNMIMPYYNQLYSSALLEFNPFYDVDLERRYTNTEDGVTNGVVNEENSDNFNQSSSRKTGETENGSRNYTKESQESIDRNSNGSSVLSGNDISNIESVENSTNASTDNTNVSSNNSENSNKDVNGNSTNVNVNSQNGNMTEDKTHWDLYSDTPQGGVTGMDGDVGDNVYLTNARKITDENEMNDNRTEVDDGHQTTKNHEEGSITNEFESDTQRNTTDINERKGNSTNESSTERNTADIRREEENNTKNDNENMVNSNIRNLTEEMSGENGRTGNRSETSSNIMRNINDYIEHVSGKQGTASYSRMLKEFRETFLNIDKMIIDELAPLFFNLW